MLYSPFFKTKNLTPTLWNIINKVPPEMGEISVSSVKIGAVLDDGVSYDDAAKITSVKIGAVLREV